MEVAAHVQILTHKSTRMRFVTALLLMMLLSYTSGLFLPWWSLAPVCFLVLVLVPLRPGFAFLCGFLALFLLWFGLTFVLSYNNNDILAHRLSPLFIQTDHPLLLMAFSASLAGVIGGLSALAGSLVRKRNIR